MENVKNTLLANYESFESSMDQEEFESSVNDYMEMVEDAGLEPETKALSEDELINDFSIFRLF